MNISTKCQPLGVVYVKVRGLPKYVGFILWGPQTSDDYIQKEDPC